ncbi:hypothetical protein [Plebeiibacterium marinum]|uniref:Uncharacterized protein n=1 Tax=Plebeiibacterium marinum TaxID=2992111 RepID=A0AAE3MF18_9BACT|nr:hypothetical protein [Plebeiobacterium marinum]MCW3805877.1 hypothetical protein [Plebeiobacterium marinum]
MKIIGLRIEKYIGKKISGHNLDFEYNDAEFEKHIILGLLEDNRKVEIELTNEEGVCGSGWCTASWGNFEVKHVDKFNGYTHKPIKELIVDDVNESAEYISNNVFSVDHNGGCDYYPSGGYNVNMDLFKANGRGKELRPTYIFSGESGIGKSALALKFNKDTVVFETDAYDTLPDVIIADVIVLGNKHKYTINDIKTKVEDTELIVCSFTPIAQ